MKAYIVYSTDNSDPLMVEEFLNVVDEPIRSNICLVDRQTHLGAELSDRYKIVNIPALIVTTDDGQLISLWENRWPLSHEISYHLGGVEL